MNIQYIPCPNCKGQIPVDIYSMLKGEKFICPNCHCTLSLDRSSCSVVENALEQYEKLMEQRKNLTNPDNI